MSKLPAMQLPVLTVEFRNADFLDRIRIETSHVNAVAIGVGAGNVERFNTADIAEQMFGNTRVERVGRQTFFALEQSEFRFGNDEVQKAAFAADRAITFGCVDLGRREDFEANPTAVAAAQMFDQGAFLRH